MPLWSADPKRRSKRPRELEDTLVVDRSPRGATLAYIEAVQPLYERLQQILTQAAGYALLVMTRGRRLVLLDAPVVGARAALDAADAQLAAVLAPGPARFHFDHMVMATDAIARALECLVTCLRPGADDHARGALSRALRLATDHLRACTRALPGFAMADLTQACCAVHAARPRLVCQTVEG